MRSGGAIPPPTKGGYLSDTCAIPYENKAKSVRYPPLRHYLERVLRDMGGGSHIGPLRCWVRQRALARRHAMHDSDDADGNADNDPYGPDLCRLAADRSNTENKLSGCAPKGSCDNTLLTRVRRRLINASKKGSRSRVLTWWCLAVGSDGKRVLRRGFLEGGGASRRVLRRQKHTLLESTTP